MATGFRLLRFKAILSKEFLQMKREFTTYFLIVAIPLIQAIFFGYVIDTDPKHLPTVVLSNDNSTFTQNFIKALENSNYFDIKQTVTSEKDANELLKKNKIQFVINIPSNFSHDLVRGMHPQVSIQADATDPVAVLGAYQAANKIVTTVFEREFKGSLNYLEVQPNSFSLNLQSKYNPELLTLYHTLPGLLGLILTSVLIMLTAVSMASEYEQGTFESLLITPIKPIDLLLGKLIPHILVGYTIYFLLLITSVWLFRVPFYGSLLLLTIISIPFMLTILGVGLLTSIMSRNQFEAVCYANLFMLPALLLSGFVFPFKGMPLFAQYIGQILPVTHYMRISYDIMLKGSNFFDIWHDLWPILVFLVLIVGLCWNFYRETLD